jgi:CheY-like chemotaxis protein
MVVGVIPPFDIFKVEPDSVRWVESADDLERAKVRVKALAGRSPGEYIILNQQTRERISVQPQPKRIFQIAYNEKERHAREELLRRFGYEVISVSDNAGAKTALASIGEVDLFLLGNSAPEETREEMVSWLKAKFPRVKIVALNPSHNREVPGADCNVALSLNDYDEWFSFLAATGI